MKAAVWVAITLFSIMLIGALYLEQKRQYHPYVVFEATDAIRVAFLQDGRPARAQCETTVKSMAEAIKEKCSICRILENRCVEKLDSQQRKILQGKPVDVPVMRIPGGALAFISTTPELAMGACEESERQTGRILPGRAPCASAAVESFALSLSSVAGKAAPGFAMPDHRALSGVTLVAMVISFLVCYAIILSERLHGRFSHDGTESGPQKFHATPTARIGGLALAAGLVGGIVTMGSLGWLRSAAVDGLYMLVLAAVPAFAGGFGEDVTKRVGVLARLMLTISAGVIASLAVGATLDRVDVPGLDFLLEWPFFATIFTAVAVGGVANAMNIIDGYHGLVGGYATLALLALAAVALQVGDPVVLMASLLMAGALLGFLIWNYPKGRIFLGDGGAYLLGFWMAELSVLLVTRNTEVSPWFPVVLLAYPIFEILFSIYRRTLVRGKSAGNADALHLHQLVYLRLARVAVGSRNEQDLTLRNGKVAKYAWAGTALFMLPAVFLWRHTPALAALALLFCLAYVWLYLRLIRWRAPAWMISSVRRP